MSTVSEIEIERIQELDSVTSEHGELLLSAGFSKIHQLDDTTPKKLLEELTKANTHLEITDHPPTLEEVQRWFVECSDDEVEVIAEEEPQRILDLEEEILIAPAALKVDLNKLVNSGINLNSLPTAKTAELDGDFNYCTSKNHPQQGDLKEAIDTAVGARVQDKPKDASLDSLEIKATPHAALPQPKKDSRPLPSPSSSPKDTQPTLTFSALIATAGYNLSVIAAIVCTVLLVFFREQKLLLIGPGSFLVFGLLYLALSRRYKCCVCHQKCFSKGAKHVNTSTAHKLPLLSYAFSMSLYGLVNGKFRCSICSSWIKLFGRC